MSFYSLLNGNIVITTLFSCNISHHYMFMNTLQSVLINIGNKYDIFTTCLQFILWAGVW